MASRLPVVLRANGWLLVLTLANLALANALVWFVVAIAWP
jgi:hypothetical protein